QRRVHVGGQRGGHRLHGDRRAAAHRDGVRSLAHHDLAGFPPRRDLGARRLGQAKINGHDAGSPYWWILHWRMFIGLTRSASIKSREKPIKTANTPKLTGISLVMST